MKLIMMEITTMIMMIIFIAIVIIATIMQNINIQNIISIEKQYGEPNLLQ